MRRLFAKLLVNDCNRNISTFLGIGGLGHALQYAKAAGFETIAVSHSPDKDKMIRDLGADPKGCEATDLLHRKPSKSWRNSSRPAHLPRLQRRQIF
jgi:hypothetical protein